MTLAQDIIADTRMGMSIGRATSQAKVTTIPEPLTVDDLIALSKTLTPPKPIVIEEWWVPEGFVWEMESGVGPVYVIHPSTWLDIRYPNRHPKYTLGHAEARLDKKRRERQCVTWSNF